MKEFRLFVEHKLESGFSIEIKEKNYDYLIKVLRKKINDEINIFNGKDGDFIAKIVEISKRSLILKIANKILEQQQSPNVALAFALVKNTAIESIAKKATEMGISEFFPIITQHSIVDKINLDRFRANVIEACEQCERNDVPEINPIKKLELFLKEEESKNNILILCDESHQGRKAIDLLPEILQNKKQNQKIITLIGPEGGFSKEEFTKMRLIKNLHSMSLGPRILRADTAIVCALSLIQEFLQASI